MDVLRALTLLVIYYSVAKLSFYDFTKSLRSVNLTIELTLKISINLEDIGEPFLSLKLFLLIFYLLIKQFPVCYNL